MNKEGYRDNTAEKAIRRASKKPPKKPGTRINEECDSRFGYLFKMLRKILDNQWYIIKLLEEMSTKNH